MTSVAEVATAIASAGVPVLYLDTCALLDIVRGHRDAFGRDHARAAVKLVELVEAKSLTLVLPEQITNELTDNFAEVQKSGTASIAALNAKVQQMHEIMLAFGAVAPAPALPAPSAYEMLADNLVARYLSVAITADTTDQAIQKASQRVITATAPAATGKQSFKDCLVLEGCFETLAAARALGFGAAAHFMSTNLAEYADPAKKALHPQLVGEFAGLGLEFAKNFLELRYMPAIAVL